MNFPAKPARETDSHGGTAAPPPPVDELISPLLQVVALGQSASAHLFLAKSLCVHGRYAPALDEVDAALRENPELAAAHCLRGLLLAFRGKCEEAVECLELAARLGGQDERLPDYWLALARVRLELAQWEESLEAVDECLAIDPSKAQAHQHRGEVLGLLERLPEAAQAYRTALRYDPLLTRARYKLGVILLKLGQDDEALQQTILARRLEPADPNTRISLGNIYAGLGSYEEAIVEYRAAVQIASPLGQALPLAKLGQMYMKLEERAEAIAMFRASLERDPKQVSCYLDMALLFENDGQYTAAIELLEAGILIDARFPPLVEALERVRARASWHAAPHDSSLSEPSS